MRQPHSSPVYNLTGPKRSLPPSHTLACFSLALALFLQRGNYCSTALSDLNEADMKGLTEMKPGSKMLIHAHSYSLAAAHWHTHKPTFGPANACAHTLAHTHQRSGEFIRGQLLKEMYRGKRHAAVACYK